MSAIPLLTCLFMSMLGLPQDGNGAAGPDLRELAARVQKAHLGDAAREPIRDFAAGLRIEQVAAEDGQDRGEAELRVQFLLWNREGSTRSLPLIRYELVDSAASVLRGRDRDGRFWAVINNETTDLGGRQFAEDRKSIVRDSNLARQMLRFVDPAGVLLGLKAPGPVKDEVLRIGRLPEVPVWTVSGTDSAFPLLHQGGEDAQARLKVFVEKATGRLVAVEVVPMDAGGMPQEDRAEFLLLQNHAEKDGVLLPMRIAHQLGPAGKRRTQLKVTLTTIRLAPGLKPEDFDRP